MPCILFFAKEPVLVNRVVDRVADLIQSVSTSVLHFRKDPTFWEALSQPGEMTVS
jgi:hypothetical protein